MRNIKRKQSSDEERIRRYIDGEDTQQGESSRSQQITGRDGGSSRLEQQQQRRRFGEKRPRPLQLPLQSRKRACVEGLSPVDDCEGQDDDDDDVILVDETASVNEQDGSVEEEGANDHDSADEQEITPITQQLSQVDMLDYDADPLSQDVLDEINSPEVEDFIIIINTAWDEESGIPTVLFDD